LSLTIIGVNKEAFL